MISNQQKLILVSVVTLAMTGIGAHLLQKETSTAAAPASESSQSYQSSSSIASGPSITEFNDLKAEIGELKQALSNTNKPRANQQENTSSSQDNEPSISLSEEEQAEIIERKQAFYAAQVMSEPVDMEWSRETLAQIDMALASEELQGINLVSSICGSTLCQLEMDANDSMPIEQSMQRLSVHRPWDGPTFFKMDDSGTVTLFFARSGHDLPDDEVL